MGNMSINIARVFKTKKKNHAIAQRDRPRTRLHDQNAMYDTTVDWITMLATSMDVDNADIHASACIPIDAISQFIISLNSSIKTIPAPGIALAASIPDINNACPVYSAAPSIPPDSKYPEQKLAAIMKKSVFLTMFIITGMFLVTGVLCLPIMCTFIHP